VKIGDLVKYIPDSDDFGTDIFGIIEEIDDDVGVDETIWVRWFDRADLNWATENHLEVVSEARQQTSRL